MSDRPRRQTPIWPDGSLSTRDTAETDGGTGDDCLDPVQLEAARQQGRREAIRARQVSVPVVGEIPEEALIAALLGLGAGATLLGGDGGLSLSGSSSASSNRIDPATYDSWSEFSSAGMERGLSLSELGDMWDG